MLIHEPRFLTIDTAELQNEAGPVLLAYYPQLHAVAKIEVAATQGQTYRHVQAVAALTWQVEHGLHKTPSVTVIDSAGNVVLGDVQHTTDTHCVLNFSAPFAGEAHCN